MADMMVDGLAYLNDQLTTFAATTYTYRRGAYSVSLSATIGHAAVEPLTVLAGAIADRDMSEPSPEHADRQISFAADDLILNGVQVTPADTDTFEITGSDGKLRVYRLAQAIDGRGPWGYLHPELESGPGARIWVNGRLKSVT
jgi:hypothetical protein